MTCNFNYTDDDISAIRLILATINPKGDPSFHIERFEQSPKDYPKKEQGETDYG
mgnify:FL=1